MNSTSLHICTAITILAASTLATGCMTQTRRYSEGEVRQVVAGFSEADIEDTVYRAVSLVTSQNRIQVPEGSNRAVLIVEPVVNDTLSRGRDAGALAESISMSLKEELMNSGKVVIYNKEAGAYAKVQIEPQYRLTGRLTERNLRQDNGDYQKEYNLNLTLVDLATGLEFWQKRIHVGKEVDKRNVLN